MSTTRWSAPLVPFADSKPPKLPRSGTWVPPKHRFDTARATAAARPSSSPSSAADVWWRWLACYAAAALLAFGPALRAPLIFDDLSAIEFNRSLRGPLWRALTPPPNTAVSGRPVVNLTFALNLRLDALLGINPHGDNRTITMHLFNLAIHLASGLLVWRLTRRLLRRASTTQASSASDTAAALIGLLWLVHQVHTEAINYVVQRTELLVSLCYLLTVYGAARSMNVSPDARTRWEAAAVAACAIGMGAKEVMVTAPVVVMLMDRTFHFPAWRAMARDRRRWFHLGLLATTPIVIVPAVLDSRAGTVGFGLGLSWYEYLATQGWAITRYLRLLLWPQGLTLDYGTRPVLDARALIGWLVLATMAAGTLVAWRTPHRRWIGFLGAALFIILAPSSSFIPIVTEVAAERRIYLAGIPVFVLAVLAASAWLRRRHFPRSWGIGASTALVSALTVVSALRSRLYADSEALHRDTIAKAPHNPRAFVGLGLTLSAGGPARQDEAGAMLERAVAVDSTYVIGWQLLGVFEARRGHWEAAARAFRGGLRVQPDNLELLDGLAHSLVARGQADDAIPLIDQLGTRDPALLQLLVRLLRAQGRETLAARYQDRLTGLRDSTTRTPTR